MDFEFINGVRVFAPKSRLELINYALKNKSNLIAVNAEKILNATEESRSFINQNIGYPDGMGAVWALQKKGHSIHAKIPGCELWLDIIAATKATKKYYIVGGKETVVQQTISKLLNIFPDIEIANYRNGYLQNKKDKFELIQDITLTRPDIVFIAMGSPKQENLIDEIRKHHKALFLGLGGSFDVFTGSVKRAPKWWIDRNLEWAFRLLKQPSRIKRQFPLILFWLKLKFNQL